jgi:hypothetical protein
MHTTEMVPYDSAGYYLLPCSLQPSTNSRQVNGDRDDCGSDATHSQKCAGSPNVHHIIASSQSFAFDHVSSSLVEHMMRKSSWYAVWKSVGMMRSPS